jgi:protocatechuate 3,4-dioxygenase beta subunit
MKRTRITKTPLDPMLKRREVLGFLGGAAVVSLVGCVRRSDEPSVSVAPASAQTPPIEPTPAATPTCVVRPQQTEGPYFVDEKLNRSDIRTDPSDGSVKQGVPLKLAFRVSQVSAACTPLRGAIVDIWHCDAEGVYSDVNDRGFSTVGQKFLRGSQVTDADGRAEFVTIYPGWYGGRTVHIHFKIRTDDSSQSSQEFTSQLYLDDALTDQVYKQSPYNTKGQRTTRNDQDGIFQRGGEQLLLQLTPDSEGYAATFEIGLEMD